MKKLFLVAALLLAAVVADAQILWKIEGKDLKAPCYVFGTHHMAPLSILDSLDGFEAAYQSVDKVCGELVMSEMQSPKALGIMQSMMAMPDGKNMSSLFSEEDFAKLSKLFKELSGMDIKMLEKVKPAVVMQQIVLLENMKNFKDFDMNKQLDSYIQAKAAQDGKKIAGLETIEKQLALLFDASLEEQVKSLMHIVDNADEMKESVQVLTDAYMTQDLDGLLKLMMAEAEGEDGSGEDLDRILFDRNAEWGKVMPEMMSEGPIMFVVGAGHLPGEKGVLYLLSEQGYEVTPVK